MKTSRLLTGARLFVLAFASIAFLHGCSSEEQPEESEEAEGALLHKGSIDNAGIVEATTVMLVNDIAGIGPTAPPLDLTLDPYNRSDPFAIEPNEFRRSFADNITKFDAIDGRQDWSPEQAATWANRMATGNYLVIDTSKPCAFDDAHSYLEIERAALTGTEHTTCGGRTPNEDALDVTFNFLARGPKASVQDEGALSDGVDSATTKASSTFPYLADLNGLL